MSDDASRNAWDSESYRWDSPLTWDASDNATPKPDTGTTARPVDDDDAVTERPSSGTVRI